MRRVHVRSSLTGIYEREHFVQFYKQKGPLLKSLKRFIGSGLKEGSPCIVIATPEHRDELEALLQRDGLDPAAAKASRVYVALDAAATLERFMVNGLPDRARFEAVIGEALAEAAGRGGSVRAFGEMVALLWEQDNQAGAILLEQLWNDIARQYAFTLFCAYPMHHFGGNAHANACREIGLLHSSAIMP